MSIRSALISFKLSEKQEFDDKIIEQLLRTHLGDVSVLSRTQLFDGLVVIFGTTNSRLTVTLRLYSSQRLVSLNAEECITSANDSQKSLFILNNKKVEKMRSELMEALNVAKVERLPILKRWTPVPNYYTSSDDRILEYDFDRIEFEAQSDFQHIKILHSPSLGNCLLLDDLQNLAEADISYTQALMKFGQIDYKDKEILILGGGDGGLLHELLKENPKFVTMVDIDAMVMSSCKQHLRGCCGQSLDSLKGDNYEVIVGDCIQYMEEYVSTNRSFDFVFNDLTDIPITANDSKDGLLNSDEEMWAFFKRILVLALQLVRPNGKYLNHAIGIGCTSTLNTYEELLKSLKVKVDFSRHSAYVPSFMEEWVFYQIWKV